MRRVPDAIHAPGQAIGGGGSKDLIDTGYDDIAGGRIYLDMRQAEEIATLCGRPTSQAFHAVQEEREGLLRDAEEMTREIQQLKAALEEAESLRQAIAFTLERGVVTNKQHLNVGLRHKPGQKRIDLSASLWPDPRMLEEVAA